jgi:DNA-binding transcriptional regulator LsrR (DeoR family)
MRSDEQGPAELNNGPAQRILTASIARRYYLDGQSKVEIAAALGLSRFKVARLLEAARSSGVVRIEIADPGAINTELSERLGRGLGLHRAVVVDTPAAAPAAVRQALGAAAAELMTETLTAADVLGLSWSRAVSATTNALTRLPVVPVVQLTGALVQPGTADSSVDLVRQAARVSGGAAHFFYAPTIVPNAATARALLTQPEIARTFSHFGTVSTAVVGVGRWAPNESTVYDATEEGVRQTLSRRGVCGEIAGVLIDADGAAVESALTKRMIGIGADQLRAVPEVIAVVSGAVRGPAVRAAVLGGFVTSIVTDTDLADALLLQS